jgi:V8-like Glu-specific endopeptidase
VLIRAKRPKGLHSNVQGADETTSEDDSSPPKRRRWYSRSFTVAALASALGVSAVFVVTPASGAAGDFASFARAVRQLGSTSRNALTFTGTPAVGALFATSAGKLSQHFCTASVINSPNGNLVLTAAHCVTGTSGTVVFVPGYNDGSTPYGVWTVNKVYTDKAWQTSHNVNDDVAILQVSQRGSAVPIENVTGAEQLAASPTTRTLAEVIGYPDSSNQPITCQNWLKTPMTDQLEFDCGGYTDGTSGGPFLTNVSATTGQGTVVGVIGGYEQGGDLPQVSYSSAFGANVAALYKAAVAGA